MLVSQWIWQNRVICSCKNYRTLLAQKNERDILDGSTVTYYFHGYRSKESIELLLPPTRIDSSDLFRYLYKHKEHVEIVVVCYETHNKNKG